MKNIKFKNTAIGSLAELNKTTATAIKNTKKLFNITPKIVLGIRQAFA